MTTTGFFGDPWPSGVCTTNERCPTPVGEDCVFCEGPIEPDAQGMYVSVMDSRGPYVAPVHRECGLRAAVGGIGHFLDHEFWCLNMKDSDAGLTYRESALEVWAYVNRIGLHGKLG